jgi:adenine phosphoribosyltransferase
MNFKTLIRDVPDFPKAGILFRDITPLLKDPQGLKEVTQAFAAHYKDKGIQKICGIESRGFMFGAPLAMALGVGFVPVRKPGKLPWTKISQDYILEYGTDKLEMHVDAVEKGERVLIVDDLLATGGTAKAVCQLLQNAGAKVAGVACVIELEFLKGRNALQDFDVHVLVKY